MRPSRSRNTYALPSIAFVTVALAALFSSWVGCAAGSTETSTGTGTPGGTGGTMATGSGGAPTTSSTGGTGGMMGCAGDEKLCKDTCVKISDPAYGCSQTGCDACAPVPNAVVACAAGVCTIDGCAEGFKNCDGNDGNGCETDILTDEQACGACGSPCSLPHAVSNCVDGKCGIGDCVDPYVDCDGDPANGCESNTEVDPKNCKACGLACPPGQTCEEGVCGLYCPKGKANCNGDDSDGCEVPLGTQTDCNFCGDDCTVPNSTSHCDAMTNACILDECQPGFMNCDSQFNTGCETNVQTDAANCGTCGNMCSTTGVHATPVCTSGGCTINCDPGWQNCNSKPNYHNNDADGCEAHTDTDPTQCGDDCKPCVTPNATPACTGGVCVVAQCNPGFANCNTNAADGCEINTKNDPLNCGTCGNVCMIANGTPACNNGTCAVGTCNPGWADCDGDVTNGCETNTGADVNNCGVCGKVCNLPNATAACTGGICTIGACNPGFQNCNNQHPDGCEIDTKSDPLNCGTCNLQCNVANGTAGCSNSQCTVASCNASFANCDGLYANGCEKDLANDVANCGTCGNNCNATCAGNVLATTCGGGSCQITACAPGKYNIDGVCSTGCECTTTGESATCLNPTSLGSLQVGQALTRSGNLVPAGQEAYLAVTFNGNTNTSYHPRVRMTAGTAEFAFDILVNCSGAALSCGTEGGSSVGLTDWEIAYTAGDPNNAGKFNPIPAVAGSGTVIIRVYRRAGKPVTCNSYTLSITN